METRYSYPKPQTRIIYFNMSTDHVMTADINKALPTVASNISNDSNNTNKANKVIRLINI